MKKMLLRKRRTSLLTLWLLCLVLISFFEEPRNRRFCEANASHTQPAKSPLLHATSPHFPSVNLHNEEVYKVCVGGCEELLNIPPSLGREMLKDLRNGGGHLFLTTLGREHALDTHTKMHNHESFNEALPCIQEDDSYPHKPPRFSRHPPSLSTLASPSSINTQSKLSEDLSPPLANTQKQGSLQYDSAGLRSIPNVNDDGLNSDASLKMKKSRCVLNQSSSVLSPSHRFKSSPHPPHSPPTLALASSLSSNTNIFFPIKADTSSSERKGGVSDEIWEVQGPLDLPASLTPHQSSPHNHATALQHATSPPQSPLHNPAPTSHRPPSPKIYRVADSKPSLTPHDPKNPLQPLRNPTPPKPGNPPHPPPRSPPNPPSHPTLSPPDFSEEIASLSPSSHALSRVSSRLTSVLSNFLERSPPITKLYVFSSFAATLLSHLLSRSKQFPESLKINWRAIILRFELWRLLTSFLYLGNFGISYFFTLQFIQSYMSSLERLHYSDPEEFVVALAFGMSGILFYSFLVSLDWGVVVEEGFSGVESGFSALKEWINHHLRVEGGEGRDGGLEVDTMGNSKGGGWSRLSSEFLGAFPRFLRLSSYGRLVGGVLKKQLLTLKKLGLIEGGIEKMREFAAKMLSGGKRGVGDGFGTSMRVHSGKLFDGKEGGVESSGEDVDEVSGAKGKAGGVEGGSWGVSREDTFSSSISPSSSVTSSDASSPSPPSTTSNDPTTSTLSPPPPLSTKLPTNYTFITPLRWLKSTTQSNQFALIPSQNLAIFLIYIWSRIFEGSEVNIFEVFNLPAEFLPFFFVLQTLIFEDSLRLSLSSIINDLVGMGIGWVWYRLFVMEGVEGGRRVLLAPRWLRRFFRRVGWLRREYEKIGMEFE